MEYLLLAVAFFTSIGGVTGNTIDKSKNGLHRIKPLGWALISLALLAFTVSTSILYQRESEQRKIKGIMNFELCTISFDFKIKMDESLSRSGTLNGFYRTKTGPKWLGRKIIDNKRGYSKWRNALIRMEERGKFAEFDQQVNDYNTKINALLSKYSNYLDAKKVKKLSQSAVHLYNWNDFYHPNSNSNQNRNSYARHYSSLHIWVTQIIQKHATPLPGNNRFTCEIEN